MIVATVCRVTAKAQDQGDETPKNPLDVRIGKRIKALRTDARWSLMDLQRRLDDKLLKARLGNYEQGTRRPGIEEATILAALFKVSAAHLLCLDDNQPILGEEESKLINDFRVLPPLERAAYGRRIAKLARAHEEALPDDDDVPLSAFAASKRKGKAKSDCKAAA